MFDKLEWQLIKEHVRYLCAGLGRPDAEFHHEEPPPPPPKHPPRQPRRDKVVGDHSIYFRDKSGTLKMNQVQKQFGLADFDVPESRGT
jgi:hypothetical protein